jgi:hypothetical protein
MTSEFLKTGDGKQLVATMSQKLGTWWRKSHEQILALRLWQAVSIIQSYCVTCSLFGLRQSVSKLGTRLSLCHNLQSHPTNNEICVISGFRREVDENCALLGHYSPSSGNFLPTFRDNISVPSSGVKNAKRGRRRRRRAQFWVKLAILQDAYFLNVCILLLC